MMQHDLTIPEVAAALQVSTRTVRREIDAGNLVAVKVRRLVRIPPHELDAYRSRQRLRQCQSTSAAIRGGSISRSSQGDALESLLAKEFPRGRRLSSKPSSGETGTLAASDASSVVLFQKRSRAG